MSSFACHWPWLLGGLLGGWLLWHLFDKLFHRDGEAAGVAARRELVAATSRVSSLQTDVQASSDTMARLRADMSATAESLRKRSDEVTALTTDRDQWKAKAEMCEEKLTADAAAAAAALAALNAKFAALQKEHTTANAALTATSDEATRATTALADWKAKHATVSDEMSLAGKAAVAAAATAAGALAAATARSASLQTELDGAIAARTATAADLGAARAQLAKLTAEHTAARSALSSDLEARSATITTLTSEHASKVAALNGTVTSHRGDIERLTAELAAATATMASAKSAHERVTKELADCRAQSAAVQADAARTAATAASAQAVVAAAEAGFRPTRDGRDDLLIIEGIGPKINGLLLAAGIDTFAKLSAAPVDRVQAILDAAGPRFRLARPDTWARQAAMCEGREWTALRAYQDTLRAGVDDSRRTRLTDEQILAAAAEFGFVPRRGGKDDLEVVEGIGPRINELLVAGGIDTFAKLAAAPESRVQAILDVAGPHFRLANPASWAKQSAMCDAGEWRALRQLQDSLRAGVDSSAQERTP